MDQKLPSDTSEQHPENYYYQQNYYHYQYPQNETQYQHHYDHTRTQMTNSSGMSMQYSNNYSGKPAAPMHPSMYSPQY